MRVQAVIDWKWTRFCRRLLLWELAVFMLWCLSFFAFTVLFQARPAPAPSGLLLDALLHVFRAFHSAVCNPNQDEDPHSSLREILSTARGRATVACIILSLLGMLPFVVIEVRLQNVGRTAICREHLTTVRHQKLDSKVLAAQVSTVVSYGFWGWARAGTCWTPPRTWCRRETQLGAHAPCAPAPDAVLPRKVHVLHLHLKCRYLTPQIAITSMYLGRVDVSSDYLR